MRKKKLGDYSYHLSIKLKKDNFSSSLYNIAYEVAENLFEGVKAVSDKGYIIPDAKMNTYRITPCELDVEKNLEALINLDLIMNKPKDTSAIQIPIQVVGKENEYQITYDNGLLFVNSSVLSNK